MNLLMMTIYYPDECYQEVASLSKVGMQNQINSYQKAFMEGLEQCLQPDEAFKIINALPVGVYPHQYRKCWLKRATYENGRVLDLGGINITYFKQKMRQKRAKQALLEWVEASPENRMVLVYTLYLPYMKAIAEVKKQYPDLKAAFIVTDLPNEYGLSSGRKGLLKKLEYRMGEKQLELCRSMDGFVLLTQYMPEVIPCEGKKTIVIEGLIQQGTEPLPAKEESDTFEVLYTGMLSVEHGTQDLLDAFAAMPDVRLRICGIGTMEETVRAYASQYENIHYEGFVSHEKALALQAQANALINPRLRSGLSTRYSFPSKTLEYMRSGKPVICHRIDGIPQDYDDYLCYTPEDSPAGIQQAVRALQEKSPEERLRIGQNARDYVLAQKNPVAQCQKLVDWLRSF